MREAWDYKRWGAPNPGGRLDQPAGLIDKMNIAENTYNAYTEFKRRPSDAKLHDWIKRHPAENRVGEEIIKMRRDAR